jgi:hypothetical protein
VIKRMKGVAWLAGPAGEVDVVEHDLRLVRMPAPIFLEYLQGEHGFGLRQRPLGQRFPQAVLCGARQLREVRRQEAIGLLGGKRFLGVLFDFVDEARGEFVAVGGLDGGSKGRGETFAIIGCKGQPAKADLQHVIMFGSLDPLNGGQSAQAFKGLRPVFITKLTFQQGFLIGQEQQGRDGTGGDDAGQQLRGKRHHAGDLLAFLAEHRQRGVMATVASAGSSILSLPSASDWSS